MTTHKIFWQIQQDFSEIKTECLKRCKNFTASKKNQITFWETLLSQCTTFFTIAKKLYNEEQIEETYTRLLNENFYKKGKSYTQVQREILKLHQQKQKSIQRKQKINNALKQGYGVSLLCMNSMIDYAVYKKRTSFGPWQKDINPYHALQNIDKESPAERLSLENIATIFYRIKFAIKKDDSPIVLHQSIEKILSSIN